MRSYKQIKEEERKKIYLLQKEGMSYEKIGELLSRSKSSISREIKRNSDKGLGYLPDTAEKLAKQRRYKQKKKIDKNKEIKNYVLDKLNNCKWSPEIIAAKIKEEGLSISHETIYKYIYSKEGQRNKLYENLMYQREARLVHKSRRKRRERPEEYKIANRPEIIDKKEEFGHFEADLTFMKGSRSSNIIMLIEKLTRKCFMIKNKSKDSITTMNHIFKVLKNIKGAKSVTFDNGSEFSKFGNLSLLGIKVYFCDPHSPWQKGQVERHNALLHKFISKKSDVRSISDHDISNAELLLNSLPRKNLNFLTPNQLWSNFSHKVALQN